MIDHHDSMRAVTSCMQIETEDTSDHSGRTMAVLIGMIQVASFNA